MRTSAAGSWGEERKKKKAAGKREKEKGSREREKKKKAAGTRRPGILRASSLADAEDTAQKRGKKAR